jgi:hypothetical protein
MTKQRNVFPRIFEDLRNGRPRDPDDCGTMASCQHTIWHQSLKSSHIRSLSRGYSSFRQRSREPYILPRLVIDLDSSDNRYVRQEEDGAGTIQNAANYRPKRAQEVKTGRPGARSEITTPRKGNKTAEHESRNDRDMRRGFWTMRIGRGNNNDLFKASTTSPLDILTWALNGDEAGAETVPEQEPNIHFSDTTMDVSTSINTTGVDLRDKSIWTRIGRTFVPLARLHREISSLCSTAKGCKFLLEKESLVVMALQFYNTPRPYGTKAGSARAVKSRILRQLNNIHINMKSKGLEIGPALCNAGLYYSSVTDTSESLAMYLQIMVANGYELTEYTPWALNQVLRKVRPMDLSQATTNRLTDHTVLSLVTGTEPDGPICPLEQRNPSFASLLRQNQPEDLVTRLYTIYLVTLGKIGAGKHLMQEYQTAQNSQVSHVPRSLRGDENSVRRAQLFAVAFILARDVENAAAILKNGLVPEEHRGE